MVLTPNTGRNFYGSTLLILFEAFDIFLFLEIVVGSCKLELFAFFKKHRENQHGGGVEDFGNGRGLRMYRGK